MITEDELTRMLAKALREHPDLNHPKWMTTAQVSTHTGIARRTLESYRRKGIGPKSSKRHGNVRYNRSDVDQWLAEASYV